MNFLNKVYVLQKSLNLNIKTQKMSIKENLLIVHNPQNLLHKLTTKHHPQRPQRIIEILKYLKETQFSSTIQDYNSVAKHLNFEDKQIQKLTEEQIIILHGKRYFDFIQGMWCQGLSKPQMFINVDTYYIKQTFKSAFQAAKTMILAVESNLIRSQRDVICLIRPPGHHSGLKNQPHGFSFFNNVAIGANHYVKRTKKNAVIIDWDIHHGQGTQNIFYSRNDVLYISLHRFDQGKFFPHIKQSASDFMGEKDGKGFNINLCWNFPQTKEKRTEKQTVRDEEYIYCFQKILIPILQQYEFEAIFISCGFDCADGDPIGDSKLTKKGFKYMTQSLKEFKKPIFAILQGGYNIQTLKWGVQAVAEGLKEWKEFQKSSQVKIEDLNDFAQKDIRNTCQQIKKYWKIQI